MTKKKKKDLSGGYKKIKLKSFKCQSYNASYGILPHSDNLRFKLPYSTNTNLKKLFAS